MHNKLLTTDLFLFRASRQKVSADQLEEEGQEEKIQVKQWPVCASGAEVAFMLRRMRMGT